jgi:hypothetical protein
MMPASSRRFLDQTRDERIRMLGAVRRVVIVRAVTACLRRSHPMRSPPSHSTPICRRITLPNRRLDKQPRCGATIPPCAPWHTHSCFKLVRHQGPTSPKLPFDGECGSCASGDCCSVANSSSRRSSPRSSGDKRLTSNFGRISGSRSGL